VKEQGDAMNEPTMETLARRVAKGIKALLFPFLLVGLFSCEQIKDTYERRVTG